MGPSVKFVSPNKGLISKKKIGGQLFSSEKWPNRGGGSEAFLAKDHTFSDFFLRPSLRTEIKSNVSSIATSKRGEKPLTFF